jgi:hypothetical protein
MRDPESTLVTLCVREPDVLDLSELRAAAAAVKDWDAVLDLATRHRALAYVRRALAAAAVRPPVEVERSLGQALFKLAQKLVRLNRRLQQVAEALANEGVPLLVLKGPVLGPLLYPSTVFRPFADLDLLVPESHVETAAAVLSQCGLTEFAFQPEVARREHADHVHDGAAYHRVFYSADGQDVAELHADALQLGLQLSPEQGRWSRAVSARGVHKVLMLSPADQLVHLSVHAQKHGFNRLIWLKDLDLLVRQQSDALDWQQALSIARSEGVTASVWYALDLLRTMIGTPVPAEWLSDLQPPAPLRAIYRCVWPRRNIVALRGHMRRRAVQFHVADSWRGMLPSFVLMGRRRTRARAIADAVLH